jgi:hypothetical protein
MFEDRGKIIPHHDGGLFQVTIQIIERKYRWPGMYREVEAYFSKCDSSARHAEQGQVLKQRRINLPPERLLTSISIDHLVLPTTSRVHVAILDTRDDFSRLGVFVPVSTLTTIPSVSHLLSSPMYASIWKGRTHSL